jgi:hypothetical protein
LALLLADDPKLSNEMLAFGSHSFGAADEDHQHL